MADFVLSTDTSCDVLKTELDNDGIAWAPLTFVIDETVHDDNFVSDSEYKDFYTKVRGGAMPATSQINVFAHEEFFKSIAKKGAKNIIHLSLSGGLSNTVNSAKIAASSVMENYPDLKIYIINTLSATQGFRFLLDYAKKVRDENTSAIEAVEKINSYAAKIHHWLIVDDLMHLKRGGRISGPSAHIGSFLKIKPVIIINDKGKLVLVKKLKGTINAFNYVIEEIKKNAEDLDNLNIYLASGDADDKIEVLSKLLKQNFENVSIKTGWIGPIIGAHTGGDAVGIVFLGKQRLTNS